MGLGKKFMEDFIHKGRPWRRFPAEPKEEYVAGLDIGQSADPSALSIIRHRVTPLDSWTETKREPGDNRYSLLKQDFTDIYEVVHLQRLPLHMEYPAQVNHVCEALARPPLRGKIKVVADQTGCGAAVCDLFERAGLDLIRVIIGAGIEPVKHPQGKWVVPKADLITSLDALIATDSLHVAPALAEAESLREELKDFKRTVSETGRSSFSARSGKHDDLVLSVALAVFGLQGARRGGEFSVGYYRI
jgi:hypothetical protein